MPESSSSARYFLEITASCPGMWLGEIPRRATCLSSLVASPGLHRCNAKLSTTRGYPCRSPIKPSTQNRPDLPTIPDEKSLTHGISYCRRLLQDAPANTECLEQLRYYQTNLAAVLARSGRDEEAMEQENAAAATLRRLRKVLIEQEANRAKAATAKCLQS